MPTWYSHARTYLGLKEIKGPQSNATIMRWARTLGGWVKSFYTNDDIPWCALFVNICLAEAGLKGTGTLAARDFEKWGVPLTVPSVGAILVFVRPGGGHVGFYVGQKIDGTLRVLGGNQSDSVTETWIAASRLTAIRWPTATPLPETGPVIVAWDGKPVSTNEG